MAQLTKMMTMFLAKNPTGGPMEGVKKIDAEDEGSVKRKSIPLQHSEKYVAMW